MLCTRLIRLLQGHWLFCTDCAHFELKPSSPNTTYSQTVGSVHTTDPSSTQQIHHQHNTSTIQMAHSLDTWHTTHLHAFSPLPILAADDAQDSEKGQVQSLGRPQRSPALQKKWQFSSRWWTFSSLTLPNVE